MKKTKKANPNSGRNNPRPSTETGTKGGDNRETGKTLEERNPTETDEPTEDDLPESANPQVGLANVPRINPLGERGRDNNTPRDV